MVDNVSITPGSGEVIATDDIGGVQYQRIKVGWGADGSYNDASATNPLPVNQAGVSATGTLGALNANVALSLTGATGFAVDLRGTFTATVTFQGTIDGTNWFVLNVIPAGGAPQIASVTTATAAGAWMGNANGLQQVRAIATAYTSGTVTVVLRAMMATGLVHSMVTGTTAQAVNSTAVASSNLMGDVGIQVRANATGASSIHHIVSAATTNVAQIKATAGRVVGWCISNNTASWRYVKLHNVASATAGAGVVQTIGIPPNDKAECSIPAGIAFGTAISRSIVTGAADADATATGASEVVGDIFFA